MNKLAYTIILVTNLFIPCIKGEQTLQCGDWVVYNDEKCFNVFDNKVVQNYEDAKNTCYQNEASSLVSIHSQEEQQFLFNLITNVHHIVNDVWIGAQYNHNAMNWTDNTAVNYTHWSSGNPRNETGYECVIIGIVEPNRGKWVNEPCEKLNSFVCQKMQNWLFSYLQKTVMDLRESVKKLTNTLESKTIEFDTRLKNSENEHIKTKTQLQQLIRELTPVGTIAYYANQTAPIGWLKANGQLVSRSLYSNLFATIGTTFGSGDGSTTFTLPDLRGEFIRGWSNGRDIDKDRTLGTFQWGSNIIMVGRVNDEPNSILSNGWADQWSFPGPTFDDGFEANIKPGVTRNGITLPIRTAEYNIATNGGNITGWHLYKGTRPRNIALLACIKY